MSRRIRAPRSYPVLHMPWGSQKLLFRYEDNGYRNAWQEFRRYLEARSRTSYYLAKPGLPRKAKKRVKTQMLNRYFTYLPPHRIVTDES